MEKMKVKMMKEKWSNTCVSTDERIRYTFRKFYAYVSLLLHIFNKKLLWSNSI